MNPLELLKEKLRVKPIIEEKEKFTVAIPIATAPEKVEISKVSIVDERNKDTGFSRNELLQRLKENKMGVVSIKETVKSVAQEQVITEKKKPKKLPKKLLLTLEEDEEGPPEEDDEGPPADGASTSGWGGGV